MNKFNQCSPKFLFILVAICLAFLVMVYNAFKYLPSETDSIALKSIESPEFNDYKKENEQQIVNSETTDLEQNNSEEESHTIVYNETVLSNDPEIVKQSNPVADNSKKFEEISDEEFNKNPKKELTENEKFKTALINAERAKSNRDYPNAIKEYLNAISLTNDELNKAEYYDQIALMYAESEHYDTAITYANKAYELSPTITRELTLARLYYKLGDRTNANYKIRDILEKDFRVNE